MRRKTSFFKSLRFRILAILIFVGILPSILALQILIASYESKAIDVRLSNVRRECLTFADLLAGDEGLTEERLQDMDGRIELLSNLFHGRILVVDRDFRIVKDTYGVDEGKLLLSPLVIASVRGEDAQYYNKDGDNFEVAVPIQSPALEAPAGTLLVSVSTTEVAQTIRSLQQRELFLISLTVALAILLAIFLSTVLVKPFARVTKAIEDLTDGYQDEAISVPDYTETASITEAFNRMLGRMKVLDDSRNEFVSNVSHELKTPMTSMKVLADSLVGQEGVPEELYQEFLQDITKEIDRENKIISDLLALVRLNKRALEMSISRVEIGDLVEEILRRLRPIADKRNISLILDTYRPVEADVDEMKFTSAISNLVENGIKYNVDDGWVRVTINADHQFLFLEVADSGMGIPEESLDRVFERFYRVDKSHSKEIGGTGLGLAITQEVIQAHRGSIQVESILQEGTTFHVKLPLKYTP